jgi:hypothetical protein
LRSDGSLRAECSNLKYQKQPFLIIEVANTQKETDVVLKDGKYVESAHERISIIVILKIDSKSQCTTRL